MLLEQDSPGIPSLCDVLGLQSVTEAVFFICILRSAQRSSEAAVCPPAHRPAVMLEF